MNPLVGGKEGSAESPSNPLESIAPATAQQVSNICSNKILVIRETWTSYTDLR